MMHDGKDADRGDSDDPLDSMLNQVVEDQVKQSSFTELAAGAGQVDLSKFVVPQHLRDKAYRRPDLALKVEKQYVYAVAGDLMSLLQSEG